MARNPRRGPTPAASIDDWLNLVDPDGAFLTPGQLRAVFPHGFDPMPADQRADLRAQVADATTDPGTRSALRQWLLAAVLEWGDQFAEGQQLPATSLVRAAEHGVHLRPDEVLLDVDDANLIRLAVFVWSNGTRLDRRPDVAVAGDTWPASPVQRAETWCRESGVPLALVTDDDQWVLVWAPRGAPAASCRWRISDLADERILQAGFISLLGARRFFAVQADETLEALFRSAADAEAEITKGLGLSVRRSVELLVAAISRDDVAHGGAVLRGVPATEVYEASVTVLMRLVFLLFAEERRLLPAEDPLWAESYSVLTLRDDLRSSAVRDGEDALERRSSAWHRLLATFRAVHGGVNHDRLALPAYGGSLFDPDRFPFLEGRRAPDHLVVSGVDLGPADDADEGPGRPVAIDDRTALAILDALLTIEVKFGRTKVAQRVSYKALDVEQIGHCYEGLLDHGAAHIDVLSLGLVGPDGAEPEIWIEDLETRLAQSQDVVCDWLSDKDRCGRSASALAGLLAKQPEGVDLARLRVACGHDDETVTRVLPFWGLIRTDLRGLPIVLLPGSQYVTQTSTRRNMGAQYTTKALAEEVVQYAIEPLVYDPGPQNETDPGKWELRTPAQILDLRICDPAVGSGAILTAAGRYLGDRLIESVARYGSGEGTWAERLADLAAAPAEEQVVLARREIVDHCLYGVDKNPVAAEMAKLSLWLTTMARERPFTFLDHAIQVGDTLLGITDLEQLRWLHLEPSQRKGVGSFENIALDQSIGEAADLALRLQELSVVTVRDVGEKQRLHQELRAKLSDLDVIADTVVGASLASAAGGTAMEERLSTHLLRVKAVLDTASSELERSAAVSALRSVATSWLRTDLADAPPEPWDRRCLHWPLAFPEVFLRRRAGRFDAIVGNPPFLGGTRISGASGVAYRHYLGRYIAGVRTDRADLAAFFFLRSAVVGGTLGLLATNTISQGDTRDVSLRTLTGSAWTIFRAVRSTPWPNQANLEIAKVWMRDGQWTGVFMLDGREVISISDSLDVPRRVQLPPSRLAANAGKASEGVRPIGTGFMLTEHDAHELLKRDNRNLEVVRPCLTGKDVTDHPNHEASRWIIDFQNWPESRAAQFADCFAVVDRLVRPERQRLKQSGEFVLRSPLPERWWQFADRRMQLYAQINALERVVAMAVVSKVAQPVLVPANQIFLNKVVVFCYDDFGHLGLLASSFHWWWFVEHGSTLETRLSYTPTDVFMTFPQPVDGSAGWMAIEEAGRRLHERRREVLLGAGLGLTKIYNRVNDPAALDADTVLLRELHVQLDDSVRDAYGWTDLALDHHHWETPQGVRFTVSPAAKDEMLDRLLELNHQRYAEEVAAGLHDKKSKKAPAKRAKAVDENQESML